MQSMPVSLKCHKVLQFAGSRSCWFMIRIVLSQSWGSLRSRSLTLNTTQRKITPSSGFVWSFVCVMVVVVVMVVVAAAAAAAAAVVVVVVFKCVEWRSQVETSCETQDLPRNAAVGYRYTNQYRSIQSNWLQLDTSYWVYPPNSWLIPHNALWPLRPIK